MRALALAMTLGFLAGCTGPTAVQDPTPQTDAPARSGSPPPSDAALDVPGNPFVTTTPPTVPPTPAAPDPLEDVPRALRIVIDAEGRFVPNETVVAPGSTVTWVNLDDAQHAVRAGTHRSGPMQPGDTTATTFNTEGDVAFVCEIHDAMRGTVHVDAARAAPKPLPPPEKGEYVVNITASRFDPPVVRVAQGSTVLWVNVDSQTHNIVSDSIGAFASPYMVRGDRFSVVLRDVGTFTYRDQVFDLKGTIVVE